MLVLACGDDDGPAAVAEGSSTGGSTGSTTGSDASTDGSSSAAVDTSDSAFDPPEPVCGNGYVEAEEQCDDGNENSGDACNDRCLVPCGLAWSTTVLPPTNASLIDATHVVTGEDLFVVLGQEREITTDQKGNVTELDQVLRVLVFEGKGEGEAEPRWDRRIESPGFDLTPAGLAISTSAGALYVAATREVEEGTDITVHALDLESGEPGWVHDHGSEIADSDDLATGIAVGLDGSVLVAGRVRVGAGDDDAWLRRLDPATGEAIWTETFTGTGSGGFSVDDAGPVAVDADGSVYALFQQYVDYQTTLPVLLHYGADGGPPLWSHVFDELSGVREYVAVDLTVDAAGPISTYRREVGGAIEFHVAKLDREGNDLWRRSSANFVGTDRNWSIVGVRPAGDALVLGGTRANRDLEGSTVQELWLARLDAEGSELCRTLYLAPGDGLIPPSVIAGAIAATSGGEPLVVGQQIEEGAQSLWIGRFRAE